jgi:hypothetical protein
LQKENGLPNLTINGVVYPFPDVGTKPWGQKVLNWAVAVTGGMLQKAGGTFSLTADVDFGATYGLKSAYYKSRSATPATTGILRLGNNEEVKWRSAADAFDAKLMLGTDDKFELDAGTDTALRLDSSSGDSSLFLRVNNNDANAWELRNSNPNADQLRFFYGGSLRAILTTDGDLGLHYVGGTGPASTGILRLPNDQSIKWRNAAAGADLALKVNTSDQLEYQGTNLQPLTADGDLIVRAASQNTRLAKGVDGEVLKMVSGAPAWGTVAGTGDVVGPGSSVSGNLPRFSGTSGKIIEDSGKLAADMVTGPASAVSGNVASFSGTSGKVIADAGVVAANIVTGPASATANGIPRFSGTGGKTIKDSGVTIDDANGLSLPDSLFLVDIEAAFIASGTGQGGAPFDVTVVNVSSGSGGRDCTMPAAVAGRMIIIANSSGSIVTVFPASGDQFIGHTVNDSIDLSNRETAIFVAVTDTLWVGGTLNDK